MILGKSVSIPEKTTLEVYIRRIPEPSSSSADDRLYADLAEVEKLLEHLSASKIKNLLKRKDSVNMTQVNNNQEHS